LVVVATSRTGSDQDLVERDFGGLLDLVTRVTVAPMVVGGAEAEAFLATMKGAGVEVYTNSFDGTPGSALLDLDRRSALLRTPEFPRDALALLQALRLLRAAYIYDYPQERVRRATTVFRMGSPPAAPDVWEAARDYLLHNDWLRYAPADAH